MDSFSLQNPYNSEELITIKINEYYHDDFNNYWIHDKFGAPLADINTDADEDSIRVPNLLFQLCGMISTPGKNTYTDYREWEAHAQSEKQELLDGIDTPSLRDLVDEFNDGKLYCRWFNTSVERISHFIKTRYYDDYFYDGENVYEVVYSDKNESFSFRIIDLKTHTFAPRIHFIPKAKFFRHHFNFLNGGAKNRA